MCSNCVSAISNFNETLKLGRGANVSNEFVSYDSLPTRHRLAC